MNPYISAPKNLLYFSLFSPCFAPKCPVLQGISGICEMCVLTDILQNRARWSKLLWAVSSKTGFGYY